MSEKRKLLIKRISKIAMIVISLYLLYILVGIYLNSTVGLKYESVSAEDIKYGMLYTKILMIYIITVTIMLICSFKK